MTTDRKTIVFIGTFSGELNSLKEIVTSLVSTIRCFSFLNTDTAAPLIFDSGSLTPDLLVVDDHIIPSAHEFQGAVRRKEGLKKTVLVFYSKRGTLNNQAPADTFVFQKSLNKEDYRNFLHAVLQKI